MRLRLAGTMAGLCFLSGVVLDSHSPMAADSPDPNTGGGMGGTGYTVDKPQDMPVVPLGNATRLDCLADKVVGSYLLSQEGGSSQGQLCEQTIFLITAGQTVTLVFPNYQRIAVDSAGEVRLQVRRTIHHAWGPRVEIDVFPAKGEAKAKVNDGALDISEGFVGQISVEQGQTFFRLRRQRRD